jgi:hypothetical protein
MLPNAKLSQSLLIMAQHLIGGVKPAVKRKKPANPPLPGFFQRIIK